MIYLPPANTPLYNHPLSSIEQWLKNLGCQQDQKELHCWYIEKTDWKAEISLENEKLIVSYVKAGADGSNINRAFQYSLSRQDIENAVFSGP